MYSSYGGYGSESAMAVLIVTLIITLGLSAPMIIARWKRFARAGIPGRKSIIPLRGGFSAGKIFPPSRFFPILAFGDSQYTDPNDEPDYGYGGSDNTGGQNGNDAGMLGDEAKPAPEKSSKNKLVWIAAAILGGIALLVIGYRLWLSLCEYNFRGGTSFVGMTNFQRLFSDSRAMGAAGTTLATRLVDLALAVGLGFAGAVAGRGKARSFIAGIGLVLAIVPLSVWELALFSLHWVPVMNGGIAYNLIHALPWAGLSMFAGSLLAPKWPSSPVGAALAAPALMLLSGVSSVGMPMLYRSNNLDYMVMNYSFSRYQVGLGSAVEVLRGLITLPLAAGGIFLLAGLLRKHGGGHSLQARGGVLPATLLAGLIPLGLGLLLLFTGSTEILADSQFSQALGNSVIELFLTLLLSFGVCFGLYCLVGRFNPKSGLPLGLAFTMALALGAFSIIGYLLARNLTVLNTLVPIVINGVLDPFTLTFAFVLALARPSKVSSRLFLALAAAAFAAGRCATGWVGGFIYTSASGDLGLLLRRYISYTAGSGNLTASVVGVLLLVSCIPAALAGLFAVKGSRDA